MFNIIPRFYPKNYRMINYIFCRNKIKYPSDINNIFIKSNKGSFKINHKSEFPTDIKNLFFMSKIDIPKVNHKSSTIKNKETGKRISKFPTFVVKNSEQQFPLSYHKLDIRNFPDNFDSSKTNYYIQ